MMINNKNNNNNNKNNNKPKQQKQTNRQNNNINSWKMLLQIVSGNSILSLMPYSIGN